MMTRSYNDVNQDKQKLSAQVSPAAQLHGSARPCIFLVLPLYIFCHKLFQFAKSLSKSCSHQLPFVKSSFNKTKLIKSCPSFFRICRHMSKGFPILVLLCLDLLRSSCSVSACRYSVSCLKCRFYIKKDFLCVITVIVTKNTRLIKKDTQIIIIPQPVTPSHNITSPENIHQYCNLTMEGT